MEVDGVNVTIGAGITTIMTIPPGKKLLTVLILVKNEDASSCGFSIGVYDSSSDMHLYNLVPLIILEGNRKYPDVFKHVLKAGTVIKLTPTQSDHALSVEMTYAEV